MGRQHKGVNSKTKMSLCYVGAAVCFILAFAPVGGRLTSLLLVMAVIFIFGGTYFYYAYKAYPRSVNRGEHEPQ